MAKNSKRENDRGWGTGRVAFMPHRDAILSELAEGWPVSAVYAAYRDKLGIGYRQFCRLVAAERKHGDVERGSKPQMPSKRVVARHAPSRPEVASPEPAKRGFHFDPAAIGDKDLI